jgi:hypothetical protein
MEAMKDGMPRKEGTDRDLLGRECTQSPLACFSLSMVWKEGRKDGHQGRTPRKTESIYIYNIDTD